MKAEIAALWIAALESDEYKQTQDNLRDADGFCCLGVLCDLHAKANPGYAWRGRDYCDEDANLPAAVARWAGMKDFCDGGVLPEGISLSDEVYGSHLAVLNDRGASFKEIAKIIDEYKDQL